MLQGLLLTINLTSLEKLWFIIDSSGEVFASTYISIRHWHPSADEIETVIKNLFAVSSNYLDDIETIATEDSDSDQSKRVLNKNYSYYWKFKTEWLFEQEKESLTNRAFRCFPGYSFSDWINDSFDMPE